MDTREVPILDTLATLESGAFVLDATDRLREVVAAVRRAGATGGKARGRLTITLDVAEEGSLLEVRGAIATKLPAPARARNVFFATRDHDLTPDNPAQTTLPLTPAPVVDVGSADYPVVNLSDRRVTA